MLSQLMMVNGVRPLARRRTRASVIRPNVVPGTAPGTRSAATAGLVSSNLPVTWWKLYPPSVTVMDTIRVAGAAIFSITASGSSGANRYSTIDPITRGSQVPSGSLSTSVYRQSWASMIVFIFASNGITPTPHTPQSIALPSFIRRSRYIAWWARWKPPTPKCTTPVLTRERS